MRMELSLVPGEYMSVSEIDRRIEELNQKFQKLFNVSKGGSFMQHAENFQRITAEITEWDKSVIRQLVDAVKVLDGIRVYLRGGMEIEQALKR